MPSLTVFEVSLKQIPKNWDTSKLYKICNANNEGNMHNLFKGKFNQCGRHNVTIAISWCISC